MIATKNISLNQAWEILATVADPELPVLSIVDLGIVRNVKIDNNIVEIFVTSTYSGCPAIEMIKLNIRVEFLQHGFENIEFTEVLSPAWTTEWMTEDGKKKLKQYGIAPPLAQHEIHCPQCNSVNVKMLSQFGSTACKALYQCEDCMEPFDYFKCH